MAHTAYLTVPKNEKGIRDNDEGFEDSPDIVLKELPEIEFDYLDNLGVFTAINHTCPVLLGTYETENIPANYCGKCLEILRTYGVRKDTVFAEMLKQALHYGTFVECDF